MGGGEIGAAERFNLDMEIDSPEFDKAVRAAAHEDSGKHSGQGVSNLLPDRDGLNVMELPDEIRWSSQGKPTTSFREIAARPA